MLPFELDKLIEDLQVFCASDEVAAVRLAQQIEQEFPGYRINVNFANCGFDLYVPAVMKDASQVGPRSNVRFMACRIITDDGRMLKSRLPLDRVLRAAAS